MEESSDCVLVAGAGIGPQARPLIDLPRGWKRGATADREPSGPWRFGRVTLRVDATHPTTLPMAQGASRGAPSPPWPGSPSASPPTP